MTSNLNRFFKLFICISALSIVTSTYAQSNGAAIKLIVPYPPGGSADVIARLISRDYSGSTGKTMIVENRPGAGAIIGANYVASSKQDGLTLLLGTVSSQVMTPAVNENANYDAIADFSTISYVASMPFLLVSKENGHVKNIDEIIKKGNAKQTALKYSSAGVGTSNHLAGLLFEKKSGANLEHIPYKGSSPALLAVLSGEVDIMFDLMLTALPHIESKKLRPIAISSSERSRFLPEVPTLNELGIEGFDVTAWFGIFAPKGLPQDVSKNLNKDLDVVISSPKLRDQFLEMGIEPNSMTQTEFSEFIEKENVKWKDLIADSNVDGVGKL